MSRNPSRRAFIACAGAATLALPHIARAAVRVVRIGHNNTDNSAFDQSCHTLAAAVAADPVLAPVIRVEVHGNAELGDELALLTGCSDGTVDMALTSTTVIGSLCPQAGLMDAPFLFKSADAARAALDGPIGAQFASQIRPKNVDVLAWGENGLRHITSNRPIRSPADMAGLKLRVPQSEVELMSFKALGAQPQPLPFNELREALRTGRFEAEENPIASIEAGKLYEVQKYLSLTGHIYSAAIIAASGDLMDDLSEAQGAALHRCAKLGAAKTRQLAEAAQRDGVSRLTASGMVLVGDVDVPAFMAASKANMTALGAKYGPELMQQLVAAGA